MMFCSLGKVGWIHKWTKVVSKQRHNAELEYVTLVANECVVATMNPSLFHLNAGFYWVHLLVSVSFCSSCMSSSN